MDWRVMDQAQKTLITQDGLDKLVKEYEDLKNIKRPKVVERVAKAREQGDLSENSEYHAALEEFELIDTRIAELRTLIDTAQVMSSQSQNNVVTIGSKVVIDINGVLHEFTIVGSLESDPASKKISNESPVGRALLGKKVGDVIDISEVKTQYKIVEIK